VITGLLRDPADADLARRALRLRHDLHVPHGLLLAGGAGKAEVLTAGRAIAGRLPRTVLVNALDDAPPHVAVVVPVSVPPAWRHALTVATDEAQRHGCMVLARHPVTGLRALRASYGRAVADTGLLPAAGRTGPVVMPDELVVPRMLALLDEADQRTLLAPLQPILSLPPANRSGHLHTLDAMRRSGGSFAGAAALLNLHVNSVRYRVARIEELTRRRLDDSGDRMALDLAVMLVALRGGIDPAPWGHVPDEHDLGGFGGMDWSEKTTGYAA
jgi:sugar diacid utilization regulator